MHERLIDLQFHVPLSKMEHDGIPIKDPNGDFFHKEIVKRNATNWRKKLTEKGEVSSEDRVTRIVWSRGSVAKRGPGYCSQGGYFRYRFWSTHDRKRSHLTTRETSVRGKKRFGKWRVITGAFPLPSVSFFQTLSPLHSLSVSLSLSLSLFLRDIPRATVT